MCLPSSFIRPLKTGRIDQISRQSNSLTVPIEFGLIHMTLTREHIGSRARKKPFRVDADASGSRKVARVFDTPATLASKERTRLLRVKQDFTCELRWRRHRGLNASSIRN